MEVRSMNLKQQLFLPLCLCVSVVIFLSCGSKPTDPRTVIPGDSLVYLETKDLGAALKAVTDNDAFRQAAKTVPDFSAVNGMKISVAVTGFQTTEEEITEENAVLNFKPRFVAVAETNAWNHQALSFAENKLGEFINDIYDGEIELVTSDKHGGRYYTWTAHDGRKAFALVLGSLILFGNDETAIDRCVAVRNGDGESIAKNPKVSSLAPDSLAAGYISKDGVAQIANIAGVSLAMGASEEGEVKSFIARVLPEIVRNSATEATWTASKTDTGRLTDSYAVYLTPDTAKVLGETIIPAGGADTGLGSFVPKEVVSVTRYDLKSPQVAWRSILLTAQSKTDAVSGSLFPTFSSSLFEPYAIEDPETFFSSVGKTIQTVRFDSDGDEVVVVTSVADLEKLKKSVAKEINLSKPPEKRENIEIWHSIDGELALAITQNRAILGDAGSVEKCLSTHSSGQNLAASPTAADFQSSNAAVTTIGTDSDAEAKLISALTDRKNEGPLPQFYLTETRFNQNGLERRTVSDFGLIGMIIGQLDSK